MAYRYYTHGVWVTKPGSEHEFVRGWEEVADWSSRELEGAGSARLLQDLAQRNRFVSFGDWESVEAIDAFRTAPEFEEGVARLRGLLEHFEPYTLELRAMRS
jgi:heme-degrading monooxygenase HmoA